MSSQTIEDINQMLKADILIFINSLMLSNEGQKTLKFISLFFDHSV
jgi:hypothetical protein